VYHMFSESYFNQDLSSWKQKLNKPKNMNTMFVYHKIHSSIKTLNQYLIARKPYANLGILADILEI